MNRDNKKLQEVTRHGDAGPPLKSSPSHPWPSRRCPCTRRLPRGPAARDSLRRCAMAGTRSMHSNERLHRRAGSRRTEMASVHRRLSADADAGESHSRRAVQRPPGLMWTFPQRSPLALVIGAHGSVSLVGVTGTVVTPGLLCRPAVSASRHHVPRQQKGPWQARSHSLAIGVTVCWFRTSARHASRHLQGRVPDARPCPAGHRRRYQTGPARCEAALTTGSL